MDRQRHVEVLGGGEHRVVVRVAERPAVVGERARRIRPWRPRRRPVRARPPRRRGSVSDRWAVGTSRGSSGAELADPPVVRRRVRLGRAPGPRPRPPTAARPSCRGSPCRCARRRARRCARCGSIEPNGASPRYVRAGFLHHVGRSGAPIAPSVAGKPRRLICRAPAVELQLLQPVLVEHDPQRPIAERRVDVRLPQVGRLEDVAVGIDRAVERRRHGSRGSACWRKQRRSSPRTLRSLR